MANDIFGNFTEAVWNAIRSQVRVGVVGRREADNTTTIVVPGRDHYIYVRTGPTQTGGEILEAYNKGIPRLAGAPVLLVKWNRIWTVIGVDAGSPAVTPTTYSVAYHQHLRDNGLAQSVHDLDGMPSTLAGRSGALLRVNEDEDGYYLADAASGGTGTVDSVNGATGDVMLDADDIDETASRVWFTPAEETKLGGIEAGADQTSANHIDTALQALAEKTTPIDADTILIYDSVTPFIKWLTWANIKATLKTYFDTLYVALTGAQTIAGVKTFSNGISLGNETLANYDEVALNTTWEPVVTGSVSNPTVGYSIQEATYTRIGNVVFYSLVVAFSSFSGGSGDVRISLPLTVGVILSPGVCSPSGVDLPGTSANVVFSAVVGTAYGVLQVAQDNAVAQTVQISGLAATDSIRATGFYFV